MLDVAAHQIEGGNEKAWVIEATRAVCKIVPIYGANVAGLPWTEVDFPHDLEEARTEVWPAIWKGRWRRAVYWKRTRWGAGVAAAMVVAFGAWLASTRVGPASVDWESVPPLQRAATAIVLPNGQQKWWLVHRGDSLTAELDGGGPLRIEFRAIMTPQHTDSGRYVVAVSVDGTPHDWDAFTATPDTAATFQGRAVGDRDRLQFELPPGRHVVRVTFVAGHSASLLIRVRRPE
jgi:hypothetical protein